MRAERESVLTGAVIMSTIVALALLAYAADISHIVQQGDTTLSLLPLAPSLAAVYLIRSGEHPVARKLLAFTRALLAISAVLPLCAVGAVAALGPPIDRSSVIRMVGHRAFRQVESIVNVPVGVHDLLWGVAALSAAVAAILWLNRYGPRPRWTPRAVLGPDIGNSAHPTARLATDGDDTCLLRGVQLVAFAWIVALVGRLVIRGLRRRN
jgi:hypothetical protein